MEAVELKYLEHRGQPWIQVKGGYNFSFNQTMKKAGGIYTRTHHSWLFGLDKNNYEKLIRLLHEKQYQPDVSHLKTSLALKKKFEQKKALLPIKKESSPVVTGKKQVVKKGGAGISPINDAAFVSFKKLLVLQGYSLNTIRNYCIELRVLLQLLGQRKDLAALTKEEIHSYLLWLIMKKGYGESQVNTAVNAIKFYFEQVLYQGRMSFDLPRPKKPWVLPKVHDQEKVAGMILQTTNEKHRTMLMLAYGCGLRLSEILNLRIEDIDSSRMVIMVKRAKGKKDRQVVLPELLLQQMRKYYQAYRPEKWLFEGQRGGQYGYRSLQLVFQQAKKKAGIRAKGGIHTLRHSYATHLLEKGTDIRVIQELLGHNTIKTTMRYTHVSRAQIGRVRSPLDELGLDTA